MLLTIQEERQTLLSSFLSVKTEFYDLDGLSWADSPYNELVRPSLQSLVFLFAL